jgi:hypothetical protein
MPASFQSFRAEPDSPTGDPSREYDGTNSLPRWAARERCDALGRLSYMQVSSRERLDCGGHRNPDLADYPLRMICP